MKAIIFDMDGTMVDNMMVHHRAWQHTLKELGIEFTLEQVKAEIHGINEEIIKRLFGDRFSPEERHKIAWDKEARYRTIFKDQLQLIAGLPKFLDELHQEQIPLAIGTAAPPENVDFVLDELKLRPRFRSVLHAQNVTKGKPDPEIFIKSADNLGIDIADCVVFEDSVVGVETALNAGCTVVVVTTTHQVSEFDQFSNILSFIIDYQQITISKLNTLFNDFHASKLQ